MSGLRSDRVVFVLCAVAFLSELFRAEPVQAAPGDRRLNLSGSVGLSLVNDSSSEGSGVGGWLSAGYVFRANSWFSPRAYVGGVWTSPQDDCEENVSPCDVSAALGVLGAKTRFKLPIPYVAPFFEVGLGASVGKLSTRAGFANGTQHSGVAVHIPFSVGLALGREHDIELAFRYLAHPDQNQMVAAVAVALEFPLPTPASTSLLGASRPSLPYRAGQEIAEGYEVTERFWRLPLVVGGVALGAPYAVSLLATWQVQSFSSYLAIPLAGPWIALATKGPKPYCYDLCAVDPIERIVLVINGLAQATGAALLGLGLSRTEQRLTRTASPSVIVLPSTLRAHNSNTLGYGASLLGRF